MAVRARTSSRGRVSTTRRTRASVRVRARFGVPLGGKMVPIHGSIRFVHNTNFIDKNGKHLVELSAIEKGTGKILARGHVTAAEYNKLRSEMMHQMKKRKPGTSWLVGAAMDPHIAVKVFAFIMQHV